MCLEVKSTCLLLNIMIKQRKIKRAKLYDTIINVCNQIGKSFPDAYCDRWGDSIPYALEQLNGIISEKKIGDTIEYELNSKWGQDSLDKYVMCMYPSEFQKDLPTYVDKALWNSHAK